MKKETRVGRGGKVREEGQRGGAAGVWISMAVDRESDGDGVDPRGTPVTEEKKKKKNGRR